MKLTPFFLVLVPAFFLATCTPPPPSPVPADQDTSLDTPKKDWALALHGGAGYMDPKNYSDEQIAEYTRELANALELGSNLLSKGGSSLDAVETVIAYLEDCPLFNAGKGAVFTSEGNNEMDASIMSGADLNCGAVTGIQNVRHPIQAARAVMEESKHVFFSGQGATRFAKSQGLEMVDSSYFKTEDTWNRYLKIKAEREQQAFLERKPLKMGTVGCAALDRSGNLAAGTSTGGMMMKENGRIGDSPVIAAGTYADNESCAISCTGHGEYFIRAAVAHDIAARFQYKDISFQEATDEVVMDKLVEMKGDGGVIGVDKSGNIVLTTNTPGMFRACADSEGLNYVGIFGSGLK